MGKTLLLLGLGLSLCLTTLAATAAGSLRPAIDFPLPVDSYHDEQIPSLFGKLTGRIQREPLNLVATSPPVVIVASVWNWDLVHRLTHFGWKAVIGIVFSNLLYLTVFRREFARIAACVPDEEQDQNGHRPIPWRITGNSDAGPIYSVPSSRGRPQ